MMHSLNQLSVLKLGTALRSTCKTHELLGDCFSDCHAGEHFNPEPLTAGIHLQKDDLSVGTKNAVDCPINEPHLIHQRAQFCSDVKRQLKGFVWRVFEVVFAPVNSRLVALL